MMQFHPQKIQQIHGHPNYSILRSHHSSVTVTQLFNSTVTQKPFRRMLMSLSVRTISPKFRLPRFCKSTFCIIFFKSLLRGPANTFLGYRMLIQRILPTCFSLICYFYVFFSLSSPQRFPKKYCQTNWIWYWFWNSIFLIFFASSSAVNSWFFDKGCFLCLCEPLTERKKLNKTTIGVKLKRKSIWIHE